MTRSSPPALPRVHNALILQCVSESRCWLRFLVLILFASFLPVDAQNSSGYVFIAPGRETGYGSFFHYGLGGDWGLGKGVGATAEIGGLTGRRSGAPDFALLSGGLSYHIPLQSSLDPFIVGGVSLVTTGGAGDVLGHFGGGANWWFRPRLAVRAELRNHFWPAASRDLFALRFGVAFR